MLDEQLQQQQNHRSIKGIWRLRSLEWGLFSWLSWVWDVVSAVCLTYISSLHHTVCFRIDFKILLLVFEALSSQDGSYICDLLTPCVSDRCLRSSGRALLMIPKSQLVTNGDRTLLAWPGGEWMEYCTDYMSHFSCLIVLNLWSIFQELGADPRSVWSSVLWPHQLQTQTDLLTGQPNLLGLPLLAQGNSLKMVIVSTDSELYISTSLHQMLTYTWVTECSLHSAKTKYRCELSQDILKL